MEVINTGDAQAKPSVVMMVYGEGGVGKTSFASTSPSPILADCENGAKYFGLRGIKIDVARVQSWSDMNFNDGFGSLAKDDKYQTIVIDPIGELMEKLKAFMVAKGDRKLVQSDGSPSMAGWGWLKDTMKNYIKVLRDLGKNVLIIAHVDEKQDEDRLVKRPFIQTRIDKDIVNMVDVVGYMTTVRDTNGDEKRVIYVDPANDKITCKDRTGQLGKYIPPDFDLITKAIQGTENFKWAKSAKAESTTAEDEKPASQNAKKVETSKGSKKSAVQDKIKKSNGKK